MKTIFSELKTPLSVYGHRNPLSGYAATRLMELGIAPVHTDYSKSTVYAIILDPINGYGVNTSKGFISLDILRTIVNFNDNSYPHSFIWERDGYLWANYAPREDMYSIKPGYIFIATSNNDMVQLIRHNMVDYCENVIRIQQSYTDTDIDCIGSVPTEYIRSILSDINNANYYNFVFHKKVWRKFGTVTACSPNILQHEFDITAQDYCIVIMGETLESIVDVITDKKEIDATYRQQVNGGTTPKTETQYHTIWDDIWKKTVITLSEEFPDTILR